MRLFYSQRKPRLQAQRIEGRLWGGFSQLGLAELSALAADTGYSCRERSHACLALARWHYAESDYTATLRWVNELQTVAPRESKAKHVCMLKADLLIRLGRAEEVDGALRGLWPRLTRDRDYVWTRANALMCGDKLPAAVEEPNRLALINTIFRRAKLAPLSAIDWNLPLTLENLETRGNPPPIVDGPLVSVLVPVFRAAITLPTALRSLCRQTWQNLEIIVIDDASNDETSNIAERMAQDDARIKVLWATTNAGSYAARNAGLQIARGEFVTTHDADDWSHPQKIATQVGWMLKDKDCAANFSEWIRCTSRLHAVWLHRPWSSFLAKNMSSLLVRRSLLLELGGWDHVRVSGDTELLRRLEKTAGRANLHVVRAGAPLAFGRHEQGSLTQATATHVRTRHYGARWEYENAAAYWHARARSLRINDRQRPFPAPLSIRSKSLRHEAVDVAFVSDFRLQGGAFVSTYNYIRAAEAAGLRVAAFDWPRADLVGASRRGVNPLLRAFAAEGKVQIVCPGESIRTETLIFGYPPILAHGIDNRPEIESGRRIMIVNQMAARLTDGSDAQYDPAQVDQNIRDWFGGVAVWAPISGLVQRLMREDPRYPEPHENIWTPLIDTGEWCAEPLVWRGKERAQPVIGRHARDHYTKWPSRSEAIRQAYCAEEACEVRLLGGSLRAEEILGHRPGNWTVLGFGELPAMDFLRDLDFFVHFPHENYIEEFGRAVLEALAMGKPAILPPVFESTFGPAAVYCQPTQVWETACSMWRDPGAYLAQGSKGREFVMQHADWRELVPRLKRA